MKTRTVISLALPLSISLVIAAESDAPEIAERRIDRPINTFGETADLASPESACAHWQRMTAARNADALSASSLIPLDPREQEQWFQQEEARDPEGLRLYLGAVGNSTLLIVQTWRDDLAAVVTRLSFPQGKGQLPYSSRVFGRIDGQWQNMGETRFASEDAAKENFVTKKDALWSQYQELKKKRPRPSPPPAINLRIHLGQPAPADHGSQQETNLIERLQKLDPAIEQIRTDWNAAFNAALDRNRTNALTSLERLIPQVRKVHAELAKTELDAPIQQALTQFEALAQILHKGDFDAAVTAIKKLDQLGQSIEEQIQRIRENPGAAPPAKVAQP